MENVRKLNFPLTLVTILILEKKKNVKLLDLVRSYEIMDFQCISNTIFYNYC